MWRAAVRLRHSDDFCTRPIEREAHDIVAGGTAPPIDRLVVIGSGEEARAAPHRRALTGEPTEPFVLHRAGVLQLVHERMAEALAIRAQHARVALKELERT